MLSGPAEEPPIMTKQTIAVEHVRIESAKAFADVRAALERTVPHLDPSLVKALNEGDVERAAREKKEGPLYAPIRVVLYENDAGHGVFEYDQPSTTFGQFGDEQVTAVARGLDSALTRALTKAAE
jgi:hypothetical protein